MTDLAVAHVIVRGQTDGFAVCLQAGVGAFCKKLIKNGSVCKSDSIADTGFGEADAVHNDKKNFFAHFKSSLIWKQP